MRPCATSKQKKSLVNYLSCVIVWIFAVIAIFNSIYVLTSALNFNVLDQLENLTPVWKCIWTELHSSVSCLNNFDRLCFVMSSHKISSVPSSKTFISHYFTWNINVNNFPAKPEKRNRIKSTGKIRDSPQIAIKNNHSSYLYILFSYRGVFCCFSNED